MRILLIHDEIYPEAGANSRIVYRIVDELLHHNDVSITILGCARTPEQRTDNYRGCPIIHKPWNTIEKYAQIASGLHNKWLKYVLFPRSVIYRLQSQKWREPRDIEFIRWIKQHLNQFDVILACSVPYYTLAVAAEFGEQIPVVFYQMEALHGNLSPYAKNRTEDEIEIKWDKMAQKIIMTDLIYKQYLQHPTCCNADKVVLAEFPNIVNRKEILTQNTYLQPDRINICFIGQFYPIIRHPQYLFDIMEKLENTNIHLSIFGGVNGKLAPEYMEKYFSNKLPNVHYYGYVLPEVADTVMMQADILVHMGNTIVDVLPSKILDYISTGKPILNICKTKLCPTLSILANYSNCMNIVEPEEPITDELINQIVDFCTKYKGITIPFSQIEKQYEQYTPKYVGKIFYDTLHAAINEN